MSHRSFPLSTFALFHFLFAAKAVLFSSPFKGEAGRGMVLLRTIREASRRP